ARPAVAVSSDPGHTASRARGSEVAPSRRRSAGRDAARPRRRRLAAALAVRRARHLARHLRAPLLGLTRTGGGGDGARRRAHALPPDRELRAGRRALPAALARAV